MTNRVTMPNSSSIWATSGSISNTNSFDYIFSSSAKPYRCTINFKPQEKGLYYLEVVPQAGDIKVNNNYEARLFINFNVADKHHDLLAKFLGGQAYLNAIAYLDAKGFGIYGFHVN